MGFIKEFKEFAIKGNAFDLAVGVIIGGAFGKIVTSVIDDLVMPIVAAIAGKPDFSSIYFAMGKGSELIPAGATLAKAKELAPDAAIFAYGNFITVAINFLLLAFVVFLMVKSINKMKKKQADEPAAEPSSTDKLLMEIRDQLKKN
ncbi:large conductance mechanosensitive channel protein MscL [Elizabethkingia sp. HX WHF]|mgnify:CR=1 FL=1|jgi:large conductance mechanosensitive channel|uniref:Large-conductance mechanosensitive channel n=2 Tax=Elizabethkingia TaxID=308865 RepID=A0AAP1BYP8_ELIMR|nr:MULTISPECIES: large conductance mechanosensitive channel protein MscL [Elizabethkingia]MDR2231064.1 large conductance mechanosensitive channel protein MscL [Flavobacteriaceae bacterium]AJW62144.1 Large-conductance mechanosensitive channel [Elizabethkingia miricola]AQX84942.1 large-conductance mechanosensitive channel [Elizabethkingia bruuniana]ATL42646.1 large conductance mechanosensitive channel protein MscL [Elizabethkingia miricola]KGO10862.1 large-conductance mechanosensitive channel [E